MTPNNSVYSNTTSPSATSYASDGQNRYTTVGAHTMTYDGRSNLSNDGTNGVAFDGLNRITTVNSTNLSYDALDRLYATVSGATNRLLYFGGQIVAAYDGSGNLLNRYVPDLRLDQTLLWYSGSSTVVSGASWLITNAFGSVVAGAYSGTAAISTYDAFGVSGSSGISPFNGDLGFKGMPSNGSLGIYYARARTYDAALGRFLQPDPAGYVDGLHLYSFVHNSPVNGADPLGLWDGTCATFIVPNTGNVGTPGYPTLNIPVSAPGYSPQTLCSGGGGDNGQAPGGGGTTSTTPSPQTLAHQLKCGFLRLSTGAIGGAITGAAIAISTGQLELLNPFALGGFALAGGALNVLAPDGGLAGVAVAGVASVAAQIAAGHGYSGGAAAQIVSDSLGGAVPPGVAGVAINGATSGTIATGVAAFTGDTFGLGALGAGGAVGSSVALGTAATIALDKLLAPAFGCK
jgi:RHS repeat-associated protein